MKQRSVWGSICVIVYFCLMSSAHSLSLAGVNIADKVKVDETPLVLNGAGIRKASIFRVKVYVAGLYLEEKISDPLKIASSSGAKQLDMHFVRDVEADKLRDGWSEGFEKNTADVSSISNHIATFNSWMDDIEEGQSIRLVFSRDEVRVSFAGKQKGIIKSAPFQKALLLIWLGNNPPNEDLKQGLLGLNT